MNHGIIVATNPLSVEGWERFLPGELKVLKDGHIVFTDRVTLQEPATNATVSAPQPSEKPRILTSENLEAEHTSLQDAKSRA